MSEVESKFVFGAEKLPATFNYDGKGMTITVDTTNSKLITDNVSALKRAKEYGAIKELRVPHPMPLTNTDNVATPTVTPTA